MNSLAQHPFQTELAIDTHKVVTKIHRNVLAGQEGTPNQHHSVGGLPSTNNNMLTIPQAQARSVIVI